MQLVAAVSPPRRLFRVSLFYSFESVGCLLAVKGRQSHQQSRFPVTPASGNPRTWNSIAGLKAHVYLTMGEGGLITAARQKIKGGKWTVVRFFLVSVCSFIAADTRWHQFVVMCGLKDLYL